jgi:hypothetical protein
LLQPSWNRCFPGNATMVAIACEFKPQLITRSNVAPIMIFDRGGSSL